MSSQKEKRCGRFCGNNSYRLPLRIAGCRSFNLDGKPAWRGIAVQRQRRCVAKPGVGGIPAYPGLESDDVLFNSEGVAYILRLPDRTPSEFNAFLAL